MPDRLDYGLSSNANSNTTMTVPAHAQSGWITYGAAGAKNTSYHPSVKPKLTPIEMPIDKATCSDIRNKMRDLHIRLPLAVPKGSWIYCPPCKSFFTTFLKYNQHKTMQRHTISMEALSDRKKKKMDELCEYIEQKESEHLTKKSA